MIAKERSVISRVAGMISWALTVFKIDRYETKRMRNSLCEAFIVKIKTKGKTRNN
jgi:hypothetical protein